MQARIFLRNPLTGKHFSAQGDFFLKADKAAAVFQAFDRNRAPLLFCEGMVNPNPIPAYFPETIPTSTSKENYLRSVQQAVNAIRKGDIHKAVLSRVKTVPLPTNFDAKKWEEILCERYPDAFVNHFQSPQTGHWIGASPELLLYSDGKKLETVALAGTHPIHAEDRFSQKEHIEQGLVSDFIEEKLLSAGMESLEKKGPVLSKAGQIVHLKTSFSAEIPASTAPFSVARLLHPTPAVAGLPRKKVLDQLSAWENHDRRWYAGFIGMQTENQLSCFVNLRCMQIICNTAVLYLGAGIVADSDPEAEWVETELKSQTLLSLWD